jgi:hypothetical protein
MRCKRNILMDSDGGFVPNEFRPETFSGIRQPATSVLVVTFRLATRGQERGSSVMEPVCGISILTHPVVTGFVMAQKQNGGSPPAVRRAHPYETHLPTPLILSPRANPL